MRLIRRHLDGRVVAGLFLGFVLTAYLTTASRGPVNTDVAANALTAWQIAHTGEPWMDGLDLAEAGEVVHYAQREDGRYVTTRTPGQIWAAVPFYLGSSDEQDQFVPLRGNLAAATLTAIAVALVYLAVRTRLSRPAGVAVAAAFAFGTPIWSVSADALWTHCVTVLGCAGAAWALSRDRMWFAGVFLGVALLGRPHLAIIAAFVGIGLSLVRRSPRPVLQIGVASTVGLAVLVLWNRYVFGVWDIQSGYGKELSSTIPGQSSGLVDYITNVSGFLVSPDRGVIVWTPALLVMLPAVISSWRQVPDWSRWLVIGAVAYTVVQLAQVRDFGGGDAFYGYRYGLELLTCLAPLYAFSFSSLGPRARALLPWALGYQFAVIIIGATIDGLWVNYREAWTNSSLLFVFDAAPALLVTVLALVGLPTALVYRHMLARAVRPREPRSTHPE